MTRRLAAFSLVLALLLPAAARAAASTQHIASAKLLSLAKAALGAVHLNADEALVQAAPLPDQTVLGEAVSLQVGTPLASPTYVNVPIAIDVDGKYLRTVFVGYRVVRYVETAVAAHDIPAGTVLSAGDVTMARVPFAGHETNAAQVLVGRKLTSIVRKGDPIYLEATSTDQIVKAGASVVLVVRASGVALVADVVARNSGGLGDLVSVYNPQTSKTLSGTVVGPGRVEIDLPDTSE